MKARIRFRYITLMILVLALVAAACANREADGPVADEAPVDEPDGEREATRVTLSVNNPILNPILAFFWVGSHEQLGWYEDVGIEVQVGRSQGAADSTQRLIAGLIDIGMPPPSMFVYAVADGQDTGLVSVYNFRRHGQYHIAVEPDSDIETLEDLRGQPVGVPSLGDEGVVFMEAIARELGWDDEELNLIAVGPAGEATTALSQGNVVALSHPGGQYDLVEAQGVELRYLPQPEFADSVFANHLMIREDYARENHDMLADFLRVVTKGLVFFTENPEAAVRIHYDLHPDTVPAGLSIDEAVANTVESLGFSYDTLLFDDKECQLWGCNELEEWVAYIEFLGLTSDDVGDIEALFTNEYIEYANDFDEDEIRQMARDFVLED